MAARLEGSAHAGVEPRAAGPPPSHERERSDEELAEESDPAETVAALEPDVWTDVVRGGLSVAVLAAVEAQALANVER